MGKINDHPPAHPTFHSLTEIMERFRAVPYEQFQEELQDWFTSSLKAQGRDMSELKQQGLPSLPELVSAIYHEAEVKQLLNDQSNPDEPHNNQA